MGLRRNAGVSFGSPRSAVHVAGGLRRGTVIWPAVWTDGVSESTRPVLSPPLLTADVHCFSEETGCGPFDGKQLATVFYSPDPALFRRGFSRLGVRCSTDELCCMAPYLLNMPPQKYVALYEWVSLVTLF